MEISKSSIARHGRDQDNDYFGSIEVLGWFFYFTGNIMSSTSKSPTNRDRQT